jgi:hypothetical protein
MRHTQRVEYCIVINLPDGVNVFEGFDIVVNPLTNAKTVFNVWNTDITKAKIFSQKQAPEALKLVDPKGTIEARIEPFSKIKTDSHDKLN